MHALVLALLLGLASAKATSSRHGNADGRQLAAPELPDGFALCELAPRGAAQRMIFEVHSLTLSPDPPQRNSDLTVSLEGTLHRPLRGGTVAYSVSYAGYSLVREERPLCEVLASDGGLPQCPLAPGAWSVRHSLRVPWPVPAGTYALRVAAWDDAGRPVLCAEAEFPIVSPSASRSSRLRHLIN